MSVASIGYHLPPKWTKCEEGESVPAASTETFRQVFQSARAGRKNLGFFSVPLPPYFGILLEKGSVKPEENAPGPLDMSQQSLAPAPVRVTVLCHTKDQNYSD